MGWKGVNVSENLGATEVVLVATVDTSLSCYFSQARNSRFILASSFCRNSSAILSFSTRFPNNKRRVEEKRYHGSHHSLAVVPANI